MADRKTLELLTRKLADEGKLIEAGWVGLRLACIPLNASKTQLQEMRFAFMAGAQHLFSSMTGAEMLDADEGPTLGDIQRMALIDAELKAFYDEVIARAAAEAKPDPGVKPS